VAGSNSLWNDDDATALALRWISHRKFLSFRTLERHDGKALFIHHVIEAIEAVVPESFLACEWNVRVGRLRYARVPETGGQNTRREQSNRLRES
jgi:hypothetical protein